MSSAAQSIAPARAHAPFPDELVRVSRERRAERRLARRARLAFGVVAATFVAAACAAAAFVAGGLPLRVGAWPIYFAALAAQFACDFASAGLTSSFGHRVPLRTLAGFLGWVFAVDAALAPIGLAVAFAAVHGHALVLLALPLVALLRHFSHERRRRIDSALELSDAYRGT